MAVFYKSTAQQGSCFAMRQLRLDRNRDHVLPPTSDPFSFQYETTSTHVDGNGQAQQSHIPQVMRSSSTTTGIRLIIHVTPRSN